MKYCLSNRQPKDVLAKADEIKIQEKDYQSISDYIDKFPEKTIIFDLNNGEEIPEDFFEKDLVIYANKMKEKFICAVGNYELGNRCKELGINFYYRYAAISFYEVNALKEMGVCYLLIAAPLTFDLQAVKSFGIPIRMCPNIAYEDYLPHKNGICGQWVRPEDVDKYGEYVSTFEFHSPGDLKKEATLYHIYAENKNWPGDLNILIDNLNFSCDNRTIYDEKGFADRRISCKQKCQRGTTCSYCLNNLEFGSVVKKYVEYSKIKDKN